MGSTFRGDHRYNYDKSSSMELYKRAITWDAGCMSCFRNITVSPSTWRPRLHHETSWRRDCKAYHNRNHFPRTGRSHGCKFLIVKARVSQIRRRVRKCRKKKLPTTRLSKSRRIRRTNLLPHIRCFLRRQYFFKPIFYFMQVPQRRCIVPVFKACISSLGEWMLSRLVFVYPIPCSERPNTCTDPNIMHFGFDLRLAKFGLCGRWMRSQVIKTHNLLSLS